MRIAILDSRPGNHITEEAVSYMEHAHIILDIRVDGTVRTLTGEGEPEDTVTHIESRYFECVTEGELSIEKARREAAARQEQRRKEDFDSDEDRAQSALQKAYTALGAPADFEPPPLP
jgi:hypothetical protein